MKKLLIASSLFAALASSSFAEDSSFYLRLDGGMAFKNKPADAVVLAAPEAKNVGLFSAGVGGYFMDNVRLDVNFSYHFDAKYDAAKIDMSKVNVDGADKTNLADFTNLLTTLSQGDGEEAKLLAKLNLTGTQVAKGYSEVNLGEVKFKAWSVMPRLYWDMLNYGSAKFFVGAGVGYANLKAERVLAAKVAKVDAAAAVVADPLANPPVVAKAAVEAVAAMDASYTLATKTANNFAWSLHVGADYAVEAVEGLKFNLEYSYADLGTTGKWTVDTNELASDLKARSHNVTLGLRFEM